MVERIWTTWPGDRNKGAAGGGAVVSSELMN
jgi:hypothetical protein